MTFWEQLYRVKNVPAGAPAAAVAGENEPAGAPASAVASAPADAIVEVDPSTHRVMVMTQ